jgi:hypothetical protein
LDFSAGFLQPAITRVKTIVPRCPSMRDVTP